MRVAFLILYLFFCGFCQAQTFAITGKIIDKKTNKPISDAEILIESTSKKTNSDANGNFEFNNVENGKYWLVVFKLGFAIEKTAILVNNKNENINISIGHLESVLDEVHVVENQKDDFGILRLKSIEGVSINESKKSEVIVLDKINANTAIDNTREAYAKVPGLNVWESDEAGVQLGIGTRGLSPNRSSNFNIRQNGYDISADALGYPESYYTPPLDAVEKIEILRGAASLQYGTQFGGMVNFVMKNYRNGIKPFALETKQTIGSYGFYKGTIWLGAKKNRFSTTAFYEYRRGNAWRQNAQFQVHTSYFNAHYKLKPSIEFGFDYTFRYTVSQQPGGTTDFWFAQKPDTSFRNRNWFKVLWNVAALYADFKFSDQTKLTTKLFFNYSFRESLGNLERINRLDIGGNRTLIYDHFVNIGNETRLLHRYTLAKIPAALAVGVRFYKGFTDSKQGFGSENSDPDFRLINPTNPEVFAFKMNNYNASAFAENIFFLSEKLSITPGLRFEAIETNANGYYKFYVRNLANQLIAENTIPDDRTNLRSFLLGGIGTSFRPNKHLEMYGNISQNYRSVTYSDIRISNPNLKIDSDITDEKGFTSDIGLRGDIDKILNFDASIFYLAYQNRIGEIFQSGDAPLFIPYLYRTNIADSRTFGIELFGEINWLNLVNKNQNSDHVFTTFFNTSINQATYINSKKNDVNGKKVEDTPFFTTRSGASYGYKNFLASVTFTFIDKQFSDATNAETSDNGVIGIIPSYHVADFSAKYSWKKLFFQASVNNFTNQSYFTRRAAAYPGPGILPSAPIRFFFTIGFKI